MTPPRSLPLVALALAVAVVVAHARVVAGGQTWDDVRYQTAVAPPRLAAASALQAGEIPQWWEGTGLGVPLLGEPSHGALYPPLWLASTPRALDLGMLAHLFWAALGVAVWARRRNPVAITGVSDASALVAGVLVATTGVLISAALRGALPALAHLPWVGVAASWLASSTEARTRLRAAAVLGALLGLIGLAGELAALVDAVVLAVAIAARRRTALVLVAAVAAGLAISAAQWVPAMFQLGHEAGAEVHAVPLGRLIELIVPGAVMPQAAPWGPSLWIGAPLLALAAVQPPSRRVLGVLGAFAALALIAGRGAGGWPAWLGAPELHLGALALVLAPRAAAGLDALIAPGGDRAAVRALGVAAGCMIVALAAVVVLRSRHPEATSAIDRALLDGGLGVASMVGALVLAWRRPGRWIPLVLALLVLPGVGAVPSVAPVTARSTLDAPSWAVAAQDGPPPVRLFRPVVMVDPDQVESLDDAIATLAGESAWRFGIAAARSEDPARLAVHDRVWLAAAHEGRALLNRFGIGLAILPTEMIDSARHPALGVRGRWSLVRLPVEPVAAVMRGWQWAVDPGDVLGLMFAAGGGTNVPHGTVVLTGAGSSQLDRGAPLPCRIQRWAAGELEVACSSDTGGYAVVSSTPAPGWTVQVDGHPAAWLTADLLRRAVLVDPGLHDVAWSYTAPGLRAGAVVAAGGVFGLLGLWLASRRGATTTGRRGRTRDRGSPATT